MKIRRNGSTRIVIVIVIAVVCILAAGIGAMAVMSRDDGDSSGRDSHKRRRRERVENVEVTRYATDYDLELNERVTVLDKWSIIKTDYNGPVHLRIYCPSSYQSNSPRDHVTFNVYDNETDAMEVYSSFKADYENYQGLEDQGDNWFLGWEPEVCDASIKTIVCIEDNVIITAEVEFYGEFAGYDDYYDDVTPEPTVPVFDSTVLKDYVIDNSVALRDYVLNTILVA